MPSCSAKSSKSGHHGYDLEIWNELTFGSKFLSINNYYTPAIGSLSMKTTPLLPGGQMWELGNRTVKAVKAGYPEARIIWALEHHLLPSPSAMLAAVMDGQSYHPYGVGTRRYPDQEQMPTQPLAQCGQVQPENGSPNARGMGARFSSDRKPDASHQPAEPIPPSAGNRALYHYMSEHGVYPGVELARERPDQAWEIKAKSRCAPTASG